MALVMAITVFAGAIPAISMAVETDNVDTSDAMQGTTAIPLLREQDP